MSVQKYPDKVVEIIKKGGIGILPTDTMYGIVCSAFDKRAIEKLFERRKRNLQKKCIVLIGSIEDLKRFDIELDEFTQKVLNTVWPGPMSVELPVREEKFEYLSKGTSSLSFRLPNNESLRKFLSQTGPIIAPSANPEGEKPAETIEEARNYWDDLDFYVEGGKLSGTPSTIISIEDRKVKIWRQGQGQIPTEFL